MFGTSSDIDAGADGHPQRPSDREFDVLVGIAYLLREGLDLPEVGLVIVMGADKRVLRNERSLIQTMERAAHNEEGHVIFEDRVTVGWMSTR